jgi:hypothetical protein
MKRIYLLFIIILLNSCTNKPTIFLGYKLSDSSENFYKHNFEIKDNNFISGYINSYNYICGSEVSERVSFHILPTFYQDKLIELRLTGNVSSFFKPKSFYIERIIEDYKSQYGKPTKTYNSDYVYFKSVNTNDGKILSYDSPGIIYKWNRGNYSIIIQHEIISNDTKETELLPDSIEIIYKLNEDLSEKENEVQREKTKNAI